MLEITDAGDSVELFVNERSLGVQAAVPFVFDLRESLVPGENRIVIEAATTLERALCEEPKSKTGITGRVYLLK